MTIKTYQIMLLFYLFLLVSCNNNKNEEIHKLKKLKAQIDTKLIDYENKVSTAIKSDQLEITIAKSKSLINEAKNFNQLCKRSHFENDIQLFNLKKLNKELKDFKLLLEKMREIEKQQNILAKTEHICFENRENIEDVEGNIYRTVKIGSQHWMAENLQTKRFNNGDEIIETSDKQLWNFSYWDRPKLCFTNESAYYAGNVVIDSRNVCPTGWHVPSDMEWMKLVNYLGGIEVAGISMRDAYSWNKTDGSLDRDYPTLMNKSGFGAIASGFLNAFLEIREFGETATFWSSSQTNEHIIHQGREYYPEVWTYELSCRMERIWRVERNRELGKSIRCIED